MAIRFLSLSLKHLAEVVAGIVAILMAFASIDALPDESGTTVSYLRTPLAYAVITFGASYGANGNVPSSLVAVAAAFSLSKPYLFRLLLESPFDPFDFRAGKKGKGGEGTTTTSS